jgi:hypothetical protein
VLIGREKGDGDVKILNDWLNAIRERLNALRSKPQS